MTTSVVGVFCEDIREEKGGLVSLIGIYPDNLTIDNFIPNQTALNRLMLYIRVHLDSKKQPKNVALKIIHPDKAILDVGPADPAIIDVGYEATKRIDAPFTSIILRLSLAPLTIRSLGWLQAEVTIDDVAYVAGAIRLTTNEPAKAPIESTRHLSQRL